MQLRVMTGFSSTKEYEKSSNFATQAVDNIRTVVALGRIRKFYDDYMQALAVPAQKIKRVAWVQGVSLLCVGWGGVIVLVKVS